MVLSLMGNVFLLFFLLFITLLLLLLCSTTDPFDESKFRYRTESNVSVDQNLLEERNSLTGERLSIPKVKEENDPPPAPAKTGTLPTNNSSSSSSNSQVSHFMCSFFVTFFHSFVSFV